MLTIYTDLNTTNWLKYILEEFKRIQDAQFEITISSIPSVNDSPCLNYLRSPSAGLNIFNCGQVQSISETEKLINGNSIIKGSTTENKEYDCTIDLLWNAFVFLSRLEEFQTEKSGTLIKSYSSRHPRIDKSSFQIPIVNILFHQLEELIRNHYPKLEFGPGNAKNIELSHDLDYTKKTIQLRLKQTAFNTYNTLRSIAQPKKFIKNADKTIQFLFKSPSYWCFDYWESLEKSHNKRSIFYVYAQSGKTNLTSWLIDPSYQISNNGKLIDRLKKLIDGGFEIGLHGSYRSAFDKILLELEKKSLEESLGIPITRVRQHWLNYQEDTTPYLHNQLFETDSTLAWNDRMGYRSGCASKYRPYDHCNNQPFKYMEIPQIIMDSQLYDYATEEPEKMTKNAKSMLENLAKFKNVYVSISWHQRVCSNDYNWQKSYEELITI